VCLNILQVPILLQLYPDDKQTFRKADSVLRRNLELLLQVIEPQTGESESFHLLCFTVRAKPLMYLLQRQVELNKEEGRKLDVI
jgi:hypothetical protein